MSNEFGRNLVDPRSNAELALNLIENRRVYFVIAGPWLSHRSYQPVEMLLSSYRRVISVRASSGQPSDGRLLPLICIRSYFSEEPLLRWLRIEGQSIVANAYLSREKVSVGLHVV